MHHIKETVITYASVSILNTSYIVFVIAPMRGASSTFRHVRHIQSRLDSHYCRNDAGIQYQVTHFSKVGRFAVFF